MNMEPAMRSARYVVGLLQKLCTLGPDYTRLDGGWVELLGSRALPCARVDPGRKGRAGE